MYFLPVSLFCVCVVHASLCGIVDTKGVFCFVKKFGCGRSLAAFLPLEC